ncbi:hypothetical protein BW723_16410 [Polaribacter reichenbachii]|uniref:DUF3822 domain-containing protein n=1 Tax=Polaribacter reichenbachii TaxID=996801 RepID=A0A1B8TRK3_9FLAO|nr:DUF3822 family protein [Polaribacter reichenbachii]APZ47783.1 hypothetical protein BW723_16410 [Polaribacter reichenbachii]AUC18418.1 hypothetical protein BTO17_06830 [Polaribacter reichenbachii]OBY62232.1 hypothetical protein LPB301_15235 [Polaribacter reichenbachii]
MQKKSSLTSLQKIKDIKLSIQFSLDGFSFCISDLESNQDLFFTEYLFDETLNSPVDLLNKIESIFKSDTNLQQEYAKIEAIHQNNLSTLVPNDYFDEGSLESYLKYNIKTLKNDFITFDGLSNIDAKNVYIPFVNINNYLFQNFGEFEFKHHITVLIDKLIAINNSNENVMYINVSKNNFDIIILKDKKLILSNSFTYTSKEDFIYYVLFTAEQIQLNTEEFNLYFTGEINSESDIYKIAYTYIKNIYFLESENAIFNDLEAPNHSNFILLG